MLFSPGGIPLIIPALIMIIGGLMLPLVPASLRRILILLLPVFTLTVSWFHIGFIPNILEIDSAGILHFAGFTLQPIFIHPYTQIFATVFCIAAFAGGMFALDNDNPLEITAAYIYAGSALGITFAGDFITLFIYWEVMAIASTIVVLCGNTQRTRGAALRYAIMHFFGGVILLAGICGFVSETGSADLATLRLYTLNPDLLNLDPFTLNLDLPYLLILVGVLVNAAAPPFSSWVADTYPESSPSGAVFLSAFTTKTAVFVLLTLFPGAGILIGVGLFMIFYGIIYAMLENNMRRILSYSIVNQVGFMIVGIGIGTPLALFGTATHAFCHIIYKALLLMSAGSVLYMTGKHKCSELGGLYHTMKLTTVCGIIGALSISAFPLTSGFISKSMISASAAELHLVWVWFLLAAASAGVFLHAGIKFPWFVFFQKDSGMRPEDPPRTMRMAMVFLSFLCILPGLFPSYLYLMLPNLPEYRAYTPGHVVSQLQLLLFAGLAFFVALPWLKRTNTISLDLDWLWRIFFGGILLLLEQAVYAIQHYVSRNLQAGLRTIHQYIYKLHGPHGMLARNWSLSQTMLISTSLLGMFLILYYVSR